MNKIQLLRSTVDKITRMLARRQVDVIQQGIQARVEYNPDGSPRVIYIPSIPDNASEALMDSIQGFIDHEVAHVLYTDFNALQAALSRECKQIWDALEDTYIERKMSERFAGSGENIRRTQIFAVDKIFYPLYEKFSGTQTDPGEVFLTALGVPAFRAMSGQQVFERYMADKWQLIDPVVQTIGQDLISQIPNINSSWDSLDLAEKITKRLQLQDQPPQQSQQGDSGDTGEGESQQGQSEQQSSETDKSDQKDDQDSQSTVSDQSKGDEGESEQENDGDDDAQNGKGSGDEGDDSSDESDGDQGGGDSGDGDNDGAQDAGSGDSGDDDGQGSDSGDSEAEDAGADQGGSSGEGGDGQNPSASKQSDQSSNEQGDNSSQADTNTDRSNVETQGMDDFDAAGAGEGIKAPLDLSQLESLDDQVSEAISDDVKSSIASTRGLDQYVVWSTHYDDIGKPPTKRQLNNVSSHKVDHMRDQVDHMIGPITKDLERAVVANSRSFFVPGFRSGKLHNSSLFKLKTGDNRVFRRKEEHTSKDVAVQLLIDNSASMDGAKLKNAMYAAYGMAMALDRLGIKTEMMGFTTKKMPYAAQNELKADSRKVGKPFARDCALYMPLFKGFDERMTPEVFKRIAWGVSHLDTNTNVDGESIEYASKRLLARPEEGKILIVLSDGRPTGTHWNLRETAYRRLRDLVHKTLPEQGINVVGIGIKDDSVKRFYDRYVILNKVDELATTVIKEVKKLILAGAH